jgi:DNA excision repair protein ERCC-6
VNTYGGVQTTMDNVIFKGKTNFQGLEEFLDCYMEDEDLENNIDCVIIPPEPDVLTDEEDFDDNEMDNFELPRDIPGTIEIFPRNQDEVDSSDEEPLAKKIKISNNKERNTSNPKWKKTDPVYSKFPIKNDTEAKTEQQEKIKEEMNDLNPHQIFEKLFDYEVLHHIVDQTTLYANQNNKHDLNLTIEEMQVFISILLFTGYHKLPRQRNYWSLDEDLKSDLVNNSMTRNRFEEIKRYLHLANNENIPTTNDRMFKIRPLMDLLSEKFCQWGYFHQDLSIDESMVKYFGNHGSKQFIRGKPIRFGFKNWMLASSTGYCYNFDVYSGRTEDKNKTTLPLGSKVVLQLTEKIDNPAEHALYFDNFFSSHSLLKTLREKNFRATGTVRENRTNKAPIMLPNEMKKKERGFYDYRFETNDELLYVRWNDNKPCTIITNHDSILPTTSVKRWSREKKCKIDIDQPMVFKNYTNGMGGVDRFDQCLSSYRIAVRGKKWWFVLFTYLVDMAMINAWKLHVLGRKDHMDLLNFRRHVVRYYLLKFKEKLQIFPKSASIPLGLNHDEHGHFPQKLQKRLRCVCCHKRGIWKCKKCEKTLCIEKNCFENFHT